MLSISLYLDMDNENSCCAKCIAPKYTASDVATRYLNISAAAESLLERCERLAITGFWTTTNFTMSAVNEAANGTSLNMLRYENDHDSFLYPKLTGCDYSCCT
jgi:hypothetical protein